MAKQRCQNRLIGAHTDAEFTLINGAEVLHLCKECFDESVSEMARNTQPNTALHLWRHRENCRHHATNAANKLPIFEVL